MPEVYNSIAKVLGHQGRTIQVTDSLRSLGVAMAGHDVADPYKD